MSDGQFEWGKFLYGFINPINGAKAIIQVFWICLIVFIVGASAIGLLSLKRKWMDKKTPVNPPITISGQTGGEVHNSQDDVKKKIGLINLF